MVVALVKIAPWLLLIAAVVMIIGNGIIILVVVKNPSLRHNDCLYLIAALAIADFLTGIGTLPYSTNMIMNDYANCSRGSILISMVGNISGVRMNQFITLFIGLDRFYALLYPVAYRAMNHNTIAKFVTALGLLMGCIDCIIYLIEPNLTTMLPSCNLLIAIGPKSRAYRFITDLIMNVGTQIIYAIVYYKIRKLKNEQTNDISRHQFQQANQTITLLLFCSLIFLTIPSLVNMYDYITNAGILKTYGPTLTLAVCINGGFNVFIYPWTHKDFNEAIRALFGMHKNSNTVHPYAEAGFAMHQQILHIALTD